MRNILSSLISVGMSLLLLGNDADAFKDQAHRNITNQAITYMVEKEGFTPSCPTYPMIAEGSVAEDDSMRSWFHFSPLLNSWYASSTCDAITWAFVPGLCTASVPFYSNTVSNDFNWPNAVAEAGNDTGWIAVGHVLHMLEDLAVPAHTRNDPHPLNDPLEDKAANLFPVLPDGPLISVSSPQDLFQQLRAYTQSRCFSNDTCFHPDFPGPAAAREDNDYFYDAEGRKIAHKSMVYEFTGNRRRCTIDPIIAQEQYAELGPIAVRYVASLIKYYSDQTNTPCPAASRWTKIFGGINSESGYSVRQTADNGYIVAGTTESLGAGLWDVYLIKTDISGNVQWGKTYGGTEYDMGYSVQQTREGGYIVAGATSSFNETGRTEVYLIKTDVHGTLLWEKTYNRGSGAAGSSVQQANDGGYIVAGNTWSDDDDDDDEGTSESYAYLIKTDQNGDILWERTYGSGAGATAIQLTSDGGYIVTGNTGGYVYLSKVDQHGDAQWEMTYGGYYGNDGYSVQQTSDGGYIVGGGTYSIGTSSDSYLIKTDASGNLLWEKTYGGTAYDMGYSVQQTRDGGYILAGFTWSFHADKSDVYLIKTDSYGNAVWGRANPIVDYSWGHSVQETRDGGYVITGYTLSLNPYNIDMFLMKTDGNGNFE